MDTRRLFRTHTSSTLNSDISSAGFFAERSPRSATNEHPRSFTHRHWRSPAGDNDAKKDPVDQLSATDGHKKGRRSRSRARRHAKVDHIPDRNASRRESFADDFVDETSNKTAKRRFPTFRTKLLEWEIDQFLNSKVHDDPFARSALPYALRFRGSIFWNLFPQLLIVGSWATIIVCISQLSTNLGVSTVLITVLGFVTGLSLSFRVNTAYERYNEGRKYWAQLTVTIRNFSRYVWFQIPLRKGKEKADILMKVTCLKLLIGFAIALKHHLREELGTDYDDLKPFVAYLPTYARKRAELAEIEAKRKQAAKESGEAEFERLQAMEEVLRSATVGNPVSPIEPGLVALSSTSTGGPPALHRRATILRTIQASNDIKSKIVNQWFPIDPKLSEYLLDREDRISRATVMHGNLPLEILQFLAYYCREMQVDQGILTPSEISFFFTQTNTLTDILTGTERILRTPLPLAYNILCNQLAWIFVLMLPFQLVSVLDWVAIPATVIAGYVILGLAAIGLEIENPFGFDPNDLDLNRYCQTISVEVSMVMSYVPYASSSAWMRDSLNKPLAPVYSGDFEKCEKELELEDMFRILQQTVEDPSKQWHKNVDKFQSSRRSMEEKNDEKKEKPSTTSVAVDGENVADQTKKLHRPSVSSSLRSALSGNSASISPVTSPILDSNVISSEVMGRPSRRTYERRQQSVILEDEEEESEKATETTVRRSWKSDRKKKAESDDEPDTESDDEPDTESDDESDVDGSEASGDEDPLEEAQKHLPRLALTVPQLSVLSPDVVRDERMSSPSVHSKFSVQNSPRLSASSSTRARSPVSPNALDADNSLIPTTVPTACTVSSEDSTYAETDHSTKPKSYDLNNEDDAKEIYESLNSAKFL
ncbi:Bestrophin, RFP-TM, chloride channel-domain-containing protein [Lipomyces tetrasporus]|uniref:Bestrophin, RFP-TM, chloride channel-domain-containing protein n=1 Tax=Lipomyces tetrasporus TaxID=54092 RepID=A0AAD7QV66_9ASCO|nr:Bestrophin, RFP-TM, chloride channel-domain-containing protein [Lipomyces tetrasporus]KAJ8102110.1 Bestrophin, RFP-TM, chloride channel-domain-containing protein [Lipomyces tetrasporus]